MKTSLAHTTKAVIANANNIVALSVIRSLGRQGVPIVALFGKNHDYHQAYTKVVGSSRFVSEKYWFDEADYESNIIQGLLDIGKALDSKGVLFPASDHDLVLVSKHRAYLQNFYHILMPPDDMLALLLNKERFYEFADKENLPIPRTFVPGSSSDISTISRLVRYPCIIKPSWRSKKWIRRYRSIKVIPCASQEELLQTYEQVSREFSGLTVQDVVPGPESNIVCSFTYLDRQSEPLGMFLCRKIRQYPPEFGNTSLAEPISSPEVERITRRICKQLALVGYVGIEFKLDPRDKAYKIIEITPSRIDRQAGLSDTCGINIPYIWYAYLLGLHLNVGVSEKPYRWASEVNEIRSIGRYLKRGEWTVVDWFKGYRNVRRWEVFAGDDLFPFLMLTLEEPLSQIMSRCHLHTSNSG